MRNTNRPEHRATGFLLGAILALSVLYAALEYAQSPRSDDPLQLSEEFMEELDAMPVPMLEERIEEQMEEQPATGTPVVAQQADNNTSLAAINAEPSAVEEAVVESPKPLVEETQEKTSSRVLERLPCFPGGTAALAKWLDRNLKYPYSARKQGLEGRVVVSFIIGKDGSLSGLKVEHSAGAVFDAEALRVVKMMPKWEPGIENGQPAQAMIAIPIEFRLQ